jgi:hypothetical protein
MLVHTRTNVSPGKLLRLVTTLTFDADFEHRLAASLMIE